VFEDEQNLQGFGVSEFFAQRPCGCEKSARATEPQRCQWQIQRGGGRESHKQQGGVPSRRSCADCFLGPQGLRRNSGAFGHFGRSK